MAWRLVRTIGKSSHNSSKVISANFFVILICVIANNQQDYFSMLRRAETDKTDACSEFINNVAIIFKVIIQQAIGRRSENSAPMLTRYAHGFDRRATQYLLRDNRG